MRARHGPRVGDGTRAPQDPLGYLDKPVWRLLVQQVIPWARKNVGLVTVRSVLARIAQRLGIDKPMTDYVESEAAEDGRIASYQWKDPFALLEKEPSGAFKVPWWAIEDLNL